jgi:hypothetical protein
MLVILQNNHYIEYLIKKKSCNSTKLNLGFYTFLLLSTLRDNTLLNMETSNYILINKKCFVEKYKKSSIRKIKGYCM